MLQLCRNLHRHRHLIGQLTRHQTQARYRGSWLGFTWSILDPLLVFLLYLFVFTVVFQARWGIEGEGRTTYALNLFAGLLVYNLFSETVQAAPGLVLAHRHFVKKAIFPLEVLPVASLLANLIHASFSLALLIGAALVLQGRLSWTLVLVPVVIFPHALLILGLSFFFASLGVFVRDIGNLLRLALFGGLFLSPVFFPLSRLPEAWQAVLILNPLAHVIEDFRRVSLRAQLPAWGPLVAVTVLGAVVAAFGFHWFMRSKKAFSDVL